MCIYLDNLDLNVSACNNIIARHPKTLYSRGTSDECILNITKKITQHLYFLRSPLTLKTRKLY